MGFKAVANHAPVVLSYVNESTAADRILFVADRNYEVVTVAESHSVVAASATLDIKKAASGVAPASGTTILAAVFAADSTINIPVIKRAGVGEALTAARFIAPGDVLALDVTGTLTGYLGSITIVLKPLPNLDQY